MLLGSPVERACIVLQLCACGACRYWCLCSSPPGLSEDDLIVNVDVVRIVVVVVVVVGTW